MKVEVYWNLHRACWSVREAHGNLIKDRPHRLYVELEDVKWVVQKGGRERVLREGKKNVHAFARGTLVKRGGHDNRKGCGEPIGVTYNPFENETFVNRQDGQPVRTCKLAIMGYKLPTNEDCPQTTRPRAYALGANRV